MRAAFLFFICLFFTNTTLVLAISAPNQTNPLDNSTVSSSKLEWSSPDYQLYSTHPYRIQVDDNSDFSSTFRDYTTNNNYYTPTLSTGIWYWRIKSKDSGGIWSDWTNTWSFTLSSVSSSPTTTASPTPQPTSSFAISGIPTSINSNQSFSAQIDLYLPNNPSTKFYLKGAFLKSGGSNYFGQTKVDGSWIKNGISYSSQYPVTTGSSGNWSGTIDVMPDQDDNGFTGTDGYIFKIGRYSSSGSGPTWSDNEVSININSVKTDANKNNSFTKSNPTPNPSNPSKPTVLGTSVINPRSIIRLTPEGTNSADATAGAQIEDSAPQVKSDKEVNPIIFVGLFFIAAGLGYLAFLYYKSRV